VHGLQEQTPAAALEVKTNPTAVVGACPKTPFFKDHDFVLITKKKTGIIWAVNPSVFDYSGIRYMLFLEKAYNEGRCGL
jgi:hypothetical protein